MRANAVEPGPPRWRSDRHLRKVLLTLLSIDVVLSLALAFAALSLLTSSLSDRPPRLTDRMTRYLHSGQLRADAHTLAAMCQFVAVVDFDAAPLTNLYDSVFPSNIANPRAVESAAAGSLEFSNPL